MLKKIFITLILFYMLLTPNISFSGAKFGLMLWYETVIPTLLPYIFIGSLIIQIKMTEGINLIMRPLTFLLKLDKNAGFAIFAGIFFGYPACAITSIEMYKSGLIDKKTANICICAFNNVSPAFIIAYLCKNILKSSKIIISVIVIQYSVVIINSLIIRYIFFRHSENIKLIIKKEACINKNIIDSTLTASLISIAKLGGYIIIFSVISNYILQYSGVLTKILCLLVEITSGIANSSSEPLYIIMPFLYIGGICSMLQTFSVEHANIIYKKKYLLCKLIGGFICYIISKITYIMM